MWAKGGFIKKSREMETEKEKALEIAISQIEKQFGKGSIMRLGEASTKVAVEGIPTGSIDLDIGPGFGGSPPGGGD